MGPCKLLRASYVLHVPWWCNEFIITVITARGCRRNAPLPPLPCLAGARGELARSLASGTRPWAGREESMLRRGSIACLCCR